MFKSIFSKQLAAYLASVIISFAVLAIGLNHTFQDFFVSQAAETLVRQGQRIAASYAHMEGLSGGHMGRGAGGGMGLGIQRAQALAQFENDMRTLETLGASAFVVSYFDGQLEGIIATGDIRQIHLDEEMLRVFSGEIVILPVPSGDLFDIPMLTVGYPIIVDGVLWGAIFMNSPMNEIGATSNAAMRLVFFALILSLAISFVLVFVTSRTMTGPIAAISRAAKEIAAGSFGKRIEVKSKDEIGQLAQSFNHMAQSLDDTERTRREFIANISHDLRSPLTSMQGFLTATLDGTIEEHDREKYLKIVLGETERLSTMANDILELTKMQGADIQLDAAEFDMNELLRQSVLMFEARFAAKNLSLSINFTEERAIVAADRQMINRVVYNLIDNAVKFTSQSEIRLSTQKEGGKIRIEVADDGIGMDEATQNQIFDRFYKADISRGQRTGSGLGLSIVKEMLAAHGECISVKSSPGQGSIFSFTLSKEEIK